MLTAHSTKSQAANMGGKIAKVHRDETSGGGGGYEEAPVETPAEE